MNTELSDARRWFLGRLGIGAGVVGATIAGSGRAVAQAETAWRPARYPQDDWLDKIPGQHRLVLDSNTAEGMELALRFALNYSFANRTAYGLQNSDLAVLIVARHKSTAFGYNDAIWSKYGNQLSEHATFVDPATKEAPKVNVYNTASAQAPAFIDLLVRQGAHFAVCQISAQTIAFNIAKATDSDQAKIVEELNANLIGNAHLVPAGIVTLNRAQERGYSFVHAS